jgi:hypothetical protein
MAEKTIVMQLTLKCDEKVSETEIERILNRGINSVCNRPGRSIDVGGQRVEVGFVQWIEARVQR